MGYNRICPNCHLEIEYTCYKSYYSACSRNSVCKSCRTIIANKSPKRNNKRDRNVNWKGYNEIPFNWFSKYFLRNSKSKRVGSITIHQVYDLWIKQDKKCALTSIPIGFYDISKTQHSCSIDRIDSKKEYDLDNIQLVHKDINLMKNAFDQEYFIEMCKKVAEHDREII